MDQLNRSRDALCEFVSAQGLAGPLTDRLAALERMWSEPCRHYHGVDHLDRMLTVAEDLADELGVDSEDDRMAIALAAWFHDAVYDAKAKDNEPRSADLAKQSLSGLFDPGLVDEVCRLILLTAGHEVDPADLIGAIVVDSDLSILGAEPDDYERYAEGVRLEYRHLEPHEFQAGRSAFLISMAQRDAIFNTEPAHARWHGQAVSNMNSELDRLSRS